MPEEPIANQNPGQDQNQPTLPPIVPLPPISHKKRWIVAAVVVVLLAVGAATWWFVYKDRAKQSDNKVATSRNGQEQQTAESAVTGLELDTAKNYGDKYSGGLLPVGDSKYATTGAKKGYVYICDANFVPASQAGAQTRGPWFTNNNTQWDINKKVAVQGNVVWQSNITVKIENGKRVVTTNDLPDHHTGVFPVAAGDPAHQYDSNPNSISSQSLIYSLSANPAYSGKPQCMSGEVGIMVTGSALFNAFDAGGRDAGAWEVQDSCDGHPQNKGEYHYHTLSRCIKDASVQTVIGYALDGFPITGPKIGEGNVLTTDDLDECHGIVSEVLLDGKKTATYHYVMTQDFPYSVSCFRSTPIKAPGLPETQGAQQSPQSPPDNKSQPPAYP